MSIALNMGIVRGLLTLVLFLAFMTLWAWAWSKNRKADFDHLARLPLEDHDLVPARLEDSPR
jgi:cytochrome c oxidase cbb3-type subunit IV